MTIRPSLTLAEIISGALGAPFVEKRRTKTPLASYHKTAIAAPDELIASAGIPSEAAEISTGASQLASRPRRK
jgi:hypothetical protein